MALSFPASPSLNQVYQQEDASYIWTGVKWKRIDSFQRKVVTEYTDIVEQTSSTASIEPDKYNYFKITIDANTTITVPSASPYSSFVIELSLGTTAYTITWSNNVEWAGGSAPSYNYGYNAKILLEFTTYDGVNWVASELLDYTVPIVYPLLSSLTYSSTVSTTNVAGASGFNLGYISGFSGTKDGRWVSIAGEYGPAIWEFTTPGTLSTLVKRWSNANPNAPSNVNGNGGGGGTEWKPDGSKIYYMYESNGLKIISWNWNGTSLSGGTVIKSLSYPSGWSSGRHVRAMCFNSDGTSLFVTGYAIPYIYKYSVSTPYDLSTISTSPTQTKSISWATDVVISPDDTYICWKEGDSNTWKQHLFNSPLDLSNTTQVASTTFANSGGTTWDTAPIGLRFKLDGSGVLIFDKQNDQIDQYII